MPEDEHEDEFLHTLVRTTRSGEPFAGWCVRCGLEGVALADLGRCKVPPGQRRRPPRAAPARCS